MMAETSDLNAADHVTVAVSPESPLMESAVMAKPCAWMSIDSARVGLVQGYSVANVAPLPTLMMASASVPDDVLCRWQADRRGAAGCGRHGPARKPKVTLSCASLREKGALRHASATTRPFRDMGLTPEEPRGDGYPRAVQSAPIQLYCHLLDMIPLLDDNNNDNDNSSNENRQDAPMMILLGIDIVVMKREILSPPPTHNNRTVLALVDAIKMQPIASLGNGKYGSFQKIYSLPRPSKSDDNDEWVSQEFLEAPPKETPGEEYMATVPKVVEWKTTDPSPLGFNPIKAIVIPRPIGWISTFYHLNQEERIPHVAPYSFYINVARDMVAFAVYRPAGGEPLKDVQLDVEETKRFGVSVVTADLVAAMNVTSAPIPRRESEFQASRLAAVTVDAADPAAQQLPLVKGSKCTLECDYVRTVPVGAFSVIVGTVRTMKSSSSLIRASSGAADRDEIDVTKLAPVTRCGYEDEYAVIDAYVE